MPVITRRLTAPLRGRLLRRSVGIDLAQVDRVPDRLAWPLFREEFDPVPRLQELREKAPVARLTSFLGITVWVVTGEAEARTVLADTRPARDESASSASWSAASLIAWRWRWCSCWRPGGAMSGCQRLASRRRASCTLRWSNGGSSSSSRRACSTSRTWGMNHER